MKRIENQREEQEQKKQKEKETTNKSRRYVRTSALLAGLRFPIFGF